ncbi:hypothetical protein EON64_03295 [archaeon]|nr:MAG: hypothetical protein EON64_03295 [archaeon]
MRASSSVFTEIKSDNTYMDKLRTLDLSSNPLKTIPDCVYVLVNLKHLSLCGCQLQSLGDLSMLVHVVQLKLSHNYLTNQSLDTAENTLPPSLTRLDLSHNQLDAVPCLLASAPLLTALVCSHNHICQLVQLTCCSLLCELDLDYNQVQELPEFLSALTKLTSLSLAHNKLAARSVLAPAEQSIHTRIFLLTPLEQLNLQGNLVSKQELLTFEGVDKLLERRKMTKDKLLQGGGLSDSSLFGLD